MDVLTLDLGRLFSVPADPSDGAAVARPRSPLRATLAAILAAVGRGTSSGSGGDAIARRRNALLAYTAATIALGLGLLVVTTLVSAPWPTIDPGFGTGTVLAGPTGGLLLWLMYGLLGSLRVLRVPGGGTMTFHGPFVGAAMVLGGPTAGAWVAFLSTVELRELESQPWYGILANHTVLVTGAVVGALTTRVTGLLLPANAGGAAVFISAAAGAAVFMVLTTALGALTLLLREGKPARELLGELLTKIGRVTALEGALVVVLALAYVDIGWWAPLVIAGFVLVIWNNDPMPDPDPLTGLLRREAFDRRLDTAIGHLRRGVVPGGTLLGIDLDGFSVINNVFGHAVGDEVLKEVGRRLQAEARRSGDLAGRRGGDELAMFFAGLVDRETALRRAGEVHAAICRPVASSAGVVMVGASVGVVVIESWGGVPSAATLLEHGDRGMYHAKRDGGGVHVYDPSELSPMEGTSRPPGA
jgi:diguanylate cyclase (GGDEF)-like protein